MNKLITRRNLYIAWVILFVGALLARAVTFTPIESKGPAGGWSGFEALLLGWLGLFYIQIGWLANFFIPAILSTAAFGKSRAAAILAVIATIVALTSLSAVGMTVPADEAGVKHMKFAALSLGFYLWVSSFAIWIVGLFVKTLSVEPSAADGTEVK